MKITVKYTGQIRAVTAAATETFDLAENCTLSELIQEIAARHGEAARQMLLDGNGDVNRALLQIVNDVQAPSAAAALQSGDIVTLIPPISGG